MEKEVKETKTKKGEKAKDNSKKSNTIITSRLLFISVLDKIYFVFLLLVLFVGTITIFTNNNNFWAGINIEIGFLVFMVGLYYFCNWFYKCSIKTMLCLTKKEVYKESYIPFVKKQTSIPLNKITRVGTINFFWIFRLLIIHQYQWKPLFFWTWTNQEFKDELNKLITTTDKDEKPINDNKDKDIIQKDKMMNTLKYIGIALGALIIIFAFGSIIKNLKNLKITGTYVHNNNVIILKSGSKCNIDDISSKNINRCEWTYNENTSIINITYYYDYESFYGEKYETNSTIVLEYNSSNKTIQYNYDEYKKK